MKMDFECKILAGAESKAWLIEFKQAIDRLEKLAGKFEMSKTAPETSPTTTIAVEAESETEDEFDFASTPTKKRGRPPGAKNKAKASFDDEGEDEVEAESEADEPEESEAETDAIDVTAMRNGQAKKITLDMVNDAAKALAKSKGKQGRAHVLGILKKHFKTESISEIDEKDYSKALKVLAS